MSLVASLYLMYTGIVTHSVVHSLLLIGAMVCVFLAVTLYVLLTYQYINGGYYVDGLWLCSYCCLAGLFSVLVSMVWMSLTRPFLYTPIIDTTLEATIADGNDNVAAGETLQDRARTEEALFQSSLWNSKSMDTDLETGNGGSGSHQMRYIQLTSTARQQAEQSGGVSPVSLTTVRPQSQKSSSGRSSSGVPALNNAVGNGMVGIGLEGSSSAKSPLRSGNQSAVSGGTNSSKVPSGRQKRSAAKPLSTAQQQA